ncbi:hypothetical protein JXA12_00130 [Candidatus Woesearchaeota archaeon]|nr:hypothetical protein [Candidatus Woesearchaeota archaeon]
MSNDNSVKTGVDALLDLLKEKGKTALSDAAKELGIGESTIKMWVEFLVEEKVVGIEYKFTKPYVYLNEPKKREQGRIIEQEKIDISMFKKDFEKRATSSSIPEQQASYLWKDHLLNQLEIEKPFFFREARKRSIEDIDHLWEAYKQGLING